MAFCSFSIAFIYSPPLLITVVFLAAPTNYSKYENNQAKNEGLCLKCARELHIKPVDDVLDKMGISDDELDGLSGDMMTALSGVEDLLESNEEGSSEEDDDGKTATFPFFGKLFNGLKEGLAAQQNGKPANEPPAPSQPPVSGRQQRTSAQDNRRAQKRKFLDTYCIDLTARAREGKLDNMIGREEELERVIQILNRRQKNNPCLIGEPGVGKTAIAEGLAQRIAMGNVPYKLRDKEVHLLDLTALVATTFTEYRKHIEKDSALERRFQPVTVAEPSIDDSIAIIKGIAHYYEECHGVEIPDEMCRQAVMLSERYITDRFLPDKAIDLIDEACSDVNLKDPDINRRMIAEKDLENLRFERESLMSAEVPKDIEDPDAFLQMRYARIADLRSKELQREQEIQEIEAKGRPQLKIDNLARIIELWTKIPASTIKEGELQRLAGLEDRLKQHIIGQDEAVKAVCAAIRRGRVGLKVKRKPVSFIFVGGTGVGKTELVKQLAADMFDTPESLIRLDMSEFMEKFSVSRIIGSPPGYVGYDEAGQLTEKIRRRPYSVVLFDEIEKAHPDVMNILLQILDDGRITDAQGRTVNFENTIIVMTTNAGSGNRSGSVGFGGSVSDMGREKAMKALGEFLRPEFLNRVDEIICFNQLSEDDFRGIAKIMLGEVGAVLSERNIAFSWDDSLVDMLVKEAYSITYGARELRRIIQKKIEDPLAEEMVKPREGGIRSIEISVVNGELVIKIDPEAA